MTQGLDGHPVRAVVAACHGNRGRRVNHAGVVHMGPGGRQLVVQRVPSRHRLHGGKRQTSRNLVLSGDDVLDGKRVLKS